MARRHLFRPFTAGLVVVTASALVSAPMPAIDKDVVRAAAATSAYSSAVTIDNPSSYWRLGEKSGTTLADASRSADAGTVTPGSTLGATGALMGDPDTALAGGFTAPAVPLPAGGAARTVEAWFKGNQQAMSVGYGQASTGDAFSVTADPGSNTVTVSDGQDLGSDQFSTPYSINDGAWHLLDASLGGGQVTVYLDGQAIGSQPLSGLTTITAGQSLTASEPQGLDEVAVYPAAVSLAHLSARWAQGAAARASCPAVSAGRYSVVALGDTPAAYYRLGEASGTGGARVAFDASGRCSDATYGTGAAPIAGALASDADTAITGSFTANAAVLPSGGAPRTVEAWFRASNQPVTVSYGDTADGDGFAVIADPGSNTITVSDGQTLGADRFTATSPFNDGAWHLLDVTFDGTTVAPFVDAQPIVGKPLAGLTTTTAGQALYGTGPQGIDEVAVYPSALNPGDIGSHYLRGSDTATSVVRGTVTSGAQAVPGALVQLCPVGGTCTQIETDTQGAFRFPVAYSDFGITVYPPTSGFGANTALATATASTSAQAPYAQVDIALQTPSVPAGSSLTSPSSGTVTSGQPSLYWQEPTVYRTTGCKGGFGYLLVNAPDTSTGQSGGRFVPMTESPTGSGNYVAIIPPLAPLHGLGRLTPEIYCAARLAFFPQGGPETGGTTVVIRVPSSTVTGARFGNTAGVAFKKLTADLYQVNTPAGSGDQPLVLGYADGSTTTLGTYHYLTASLAGISDGSANGGGLIDIRGHGFTTGTKVTVGGRIAFSVQLVSSTQLLVVAPPGSGTGTVGVFTQGGSTEAGSYTYDGDAAALALIKYEQQSAEIGQLLTDIALAEDGPPGIALAISEYFLSQVLGETYDEHLNADGEALLAIVDILTLPFGGVGILISLGVFVTILVNPGGFFDVLIDPSGTVVDSAGAPVSGAKVTLLRQNGSTLATVPNGSQTINPSVNPLATGAAGTFSWEATAGIYQVSASSPRCLDANNKQIVAKTALFGIPPPVTGLVLALPCVLTTATAPTVTDVSPSVVTTPGGQTVTVSGSGFSGVTQVRVGSKAATSWKVVSPTALQVVTPAGTVVPVGSPNPDIQVVTPAGTSVASAAAEVAYVDPPTAVTNPGVGRGAVNQAITITGVHFTGITKITTATAGVTFSNLKVASDSTITAAASVTATEPVGPVGLTLAPASGPAITCPSCLAVAPAPTLAAGARAVQPHRGGAAVTLQLPLELLTGGKIVVNQQAGITITILENSGTEVIASIKATSATAAGTYDLTFVDPDGGRASGKALVMVI